MLIPVAGGKKKRLDRLLVEQGLAENTTVAAAMIGAGEVLVDESPFGKPGSLYSVDCSIRVRPKKKYVSRGGEKLAAALEAFAFDPTGLICADIGASTGGFTDCLLKKGAARVYAVDVGYGILDWSLRTDDRVIVLERCNARYLTNRQIPEPVDLCVVDASFISLELLITPMIGLFSGAVRIIALVKPQFELPRERVGSGGIVRDPEARQAALEKVKEFCETLALNCEQVVPSPIRGTGGNQEYLMYLTGTASNRSVPVPEGE